MALLKLDGNYGFDEYWIKSVTGNVYDARNADFYIAANEKDPTINIYNSKNVVFDGGDFFGKLSQTADWNKIYNHSATAFRVSNSPNTTIRNVTIEGSWDGIRFIPDASLKVVNGNSNGWLIEDVHMRNIRDDAIENDFAATGTLRNSFLDGVFSAFGTVNNQSAHGVMTVDDSIIVMKSFLKDGDFTHGSPFKFNTKTPGNNPDLKIINTIIAVEDPRHNGISRLKEAWSNLTESHGNYYLNLSDKPFKSNYPLPPKGFTILQGKAARDFLAAEESKWLAEHGSKAGQPPLDSTPEPSDPTPTVPKPTEPAPAPGAINGTSGNDTLIGTARADKISAGNGNDVINGKGGNDVLSGGAGKDTFVFDTKLDGSIAKILDFDVKQDVFHLDNAIFTSLRATATPDAPLRIYSTNLVDGPGAEAKDYNDFLIYDKNTGNLSYDADGNGKAHSPIVFAQLEAGLDLIPAHFWVV